MEVNSSNFEEESLDEVLDSFGINLPKSEEKEPVSASFEDWAKFNITELFNLKRGDFHALSKLDPGNMPTISRVSENNGIEGYYESPEGAEVYEPGSITVSSVSGKAFVQLQDFIATDNVVICKPKENYDLPILIFMQLMIDHVRWRYSYGRQCYKTKFC